MSTRISAGTQVVVTTEARGTNAQPVHPRGAVGIVARTPAGAEEHYLIRFPDGFETSFSRDQFEVLKQFKDRLPGAEDVGSQFELDACVIYRVTLNESFRLPCIADLVARKTGGAEQSTLAQADLVFHESEYLRLRGELQAAHDSIRLIESPTEATRTALNDLLLRVRLRDFPGRTQAL